jgi:calcineurin-like phosphoesterase family protein
MIITDLERTFVTADHHLKHTNIIKFCNRPFANAEEMDQALIDNWNRIVRENDLVFHLGDFTLENFDVARKFFAQLNGKIMVLGNHWHHDRRWLPKEYFGPLVLEYPDYVDEIGHVQVVPPIVVLEIPQGKNSYPLAITLCHYPLAVWDRKHHGAWHLHGHSHGQHQYPVDELAIDVGVDAPGMNYHPISLRGVLHLMYERGYVG